MLYRSLADAVVLFHFCFVGFVLFGGFLAMRWPRFAWLHLPSVAWGAWVEFTGRICPLTPLENKLRALGGEQAYSGGFVEHYLLPILYPTGLTRDTQMLFGAIVLIINIAAYVIVAKRRNLIKQRRRNRQ